MKLRWKLLIIFGGTFILIMAALLLNSLSTESSLSKIKSNILNAFSKEARISPIRTEYNGNYKVRSRTGNESLYDVSFESKQVLVENYTITEDEFGKPLKEPENILIYREDTIICLEAGWDKKEIIKYKWDEKTEEEIIDKTYNYSVPSTLSFYKSGLLIKQSNLIKTKANQISPTSPSNPNTFCYQANPEKDYYLKFGDNSVIIIQAKDIVGDSLLTNVTAETGDANFTHLNISTAAPYDDLVGYWSFDGDKEDTLLTTHYDFTEYGNDGTGADQANTTSTGCLSNYGNCLQLDGTGDYVGIGDDVSIDLVTNFTIMMWYNSDDINGDEGIIGQALSIAWTIHIEAGDLFFAVWEDDNFPGEAVTSFTPTQNAWEHVVGVYNGTNTLLYLNGALMDTGIFSGTVQNPGNTFIGAYESGFFGFDGQLDEVMIFNVTLTTQQISDIYNNQSARFADTGKQELSNQTYLNISSGNNRVNVTTTIENNFDSNISLAIEYFDGSWTSTNSQNITSGENLTFTITTATTNITLNYTFYAGNLSSPFYTPILSGDIVFDTFTGGVPADTEYPLFSSHWDNNGTLVDSGTAYFNVTVTHTNNTVLLEIDDGGGSKANYTAHNSSGDVYNASVSMTSAGTYDYKFYSWGNGTNALFNKSETKYYTVNASVDIEYPLFSSPLETPAEVQNYSFGQNYEFNITITSTNSTAGIDFNDINYSLSNFTDQVFNYTFDDLRAGNFSYYYWAYGNGSDNLFNVSEKTYYYNISKAQPNGSLTNDRLWTFEHDGVVANIGLTESNNGDADITYVINKDGVSVATSDDEARVGVYEYILNMTGGQNYTTNTTMDIQTLTITINDTYDLTLTGTTPIDFGTTGDFQGAGCPAELICNLTRNDTYVLNPDNTILGGGAYNYTFNTTGNNNYSAQSISSDLLVERVLSDVNLTLNNSDTNISMANNTAIDLNCSTKTGDSNAVINLFNNEIQINSGASPIGNTTTFDTELGDFNITCLYTQSQNYTNSSETWWVNITIIPDTTEPTITNVRFWARNSSQDVIGGEEFFNTTFLEEIETMKINFTLTDETGFGTDIIFYYTANGTNSCARGNLQNSVCYNFTNDNWIEVKNGTNTSTFNDILIAGDYINITYVEINSTYRIYTIILDEHYNPNVYKKYDALFNYSDVKWQDGVNQRITQDKFIIIKADNDVPLDADQYKIDARINYTQGTFIPTQPIAICGCNETYITSGGGNPETNINCELITTKLPEELTDDGTKLRAIETANVLDNIGVIRYFVLTTDENNPNKYYFIKTIKATALGYDTDWNYSVDGGLTYVNLGDGYETEANVNTFYNGIDPTAFVFKVFTNDSLGNSANSSIYNLTWEIDPNQNYPPIIDIIIPEINETLSGLIEINWTTVEPNDDDYTTNVTADNGISPTDISLGLVGGISNTTWDTIAVADGLWNITVESCENDTIELFCADFTHQIRIDNTPPNINITLPINNTNSSYSGVDINYTINDNIAIGFCWYSNDSAISNYSISNCANLTTQDWLEGVNNVTVFVNDSANNVNSSAVYFRIDTILPDVNITYPINNTVIDDINVDINVSISDSYLESCWYSNDTYSGNTSLTCGNNITAIVWIEGNHNVTVWANDSVGNINSSSITFNITITDTTPPYFDEELTNQTIAFNQSFTYDINASDETAFGFYNVNDTRFIINNSGTLINNTLLGVLTYEINISINDTSDNTNSSVILINVTQIDSQVFTYVNGSRANLTMNNNTQIWLNGTLNIGDSSAACLLFKDGAQINDGVSPLANLTLFNTTAGEFNITTICPATQNYTGNFETWYVNITVPPVDTTPPTWVNLRNFTQEANNSFSNSITATDGSGIDTYVLNDTDFFNISQTGAIINITNLSIVQIYWLNISVNDTLDNTQSGIFFINITKPAIAVLGVYGNLTIGGLNKITRRVIRLTI